MSRLHYKRAMASVLRALSLDLSQVILLEESSFHVMRSSCGEVFVMGPRPAKSHMSEPGRRTTRFLHARSSLHMKLALANSLTTVSSQTSSQRHPNKPYSDF